MNRYASREMLWGYHFYTGKKVGYRISVGTLVFNNVAYSSKGELISRLIHDGYSKDEIEVERVEN